MQQQRNKAVNRVATDNKKTPSHTSSLMGRSQQQERTGVLGSSPKAHHSLLVSFVLAEVTFSMFWVGRNAGRELFFFFGKGRMSYFIVWISRHVESGGKEAILSDHWDGYLGSQTLKVT